MNQSILLKNTFYLKFGEKRPRQTDRDVYFATKVQLQIINLHNQQMKIK